MSASIASAIPNQQQLFQAVPNAPKANAAPSLNALQAPALVIGTKAVIESASHKNNDGTFGPKHTLTAPAGAVSETAVNVQV
jgi:hypothetical protein